MEITQDPLLLISKILLRLLSAECQEGEKIWEFMAQGRNVFLLILGTSIGVTAE